MSSRKESEKKSTTDPKVRSCLSTEGKITSKLTGEVRMGVRIRIVKFKRVQDKKIFLQKGVCQGQMERGRLGHSSPPALVIC